MNWIKNLKPLVYMKAIFSHYGEPSFGRFGAGVVLLMTHAWVTYLVLKNGALPDMGGPSAFLASGVGTCYGITKMKEAKKDGSPEAPVVGS